MLSGNAIHTTPSSAIAPQSRWRHRAPSCRKERERRKSDHQSQEGQAVRPDRSQRLGDEKKRGSPDQAGDHEQQQIRAFHENLCAR
jgi:hypothetical protein